MKWFFKDFAHFEKYKNDLNFITINKAEVLE